MVSSARFGAAGNAGHDDGLEAKIPEDTAAEQEKEDMEKQQKEMTKELQRQREQQASDPIETLTVTRLKEILKSRGLKVSGNKKELQERLRAEVNTMMNQGSENKGDSAKGES
jgi:hypothetical protein